MQNVSYGWDKIETGNVKTAWHKESQTITLHGAAWRGRAVVCSLLTAGSDG